MNELTIDTYIQVTQKSMAVIKSCRTLKQLRTANNYVKLTAPYLSTTQYIYLLYALQSKEIELNRITFK